MLGQSFLFPFLFFFLWRFWEHFPFYSYPPQRRMGAWDNWDTLPPLPCSKTSSERPHWVTDHQLFQRFLCKLHQWACSFACTFFLQASVEHGILKTKIYMVLILHPNLTGIVPVVKAFSQDISVWFTKTDFERKTEQAHKGEAKFWPFVITCFPFPAKARRFIEIHFLCDPSIAEHQWQW